MSGEKPDYRKNPMVLLAWGLGPDFNPDRAGAGRWKARVVYMILALGVAAAALVLSSF